MPTDTTLERDPRWEKVWARIGEPEIHPSDIETGYAETLKLWIEFRIEVVLDGTRWYQVQQIHKADINSFQFDIWGFVLDKMVEQLDEAIERGVVDDS
jgi:hypothetical protein